MGLLFETIFLTKNNVKSGDKTHQRGRKAQKTVACGKRGNGKFSICSKSPQKAATNWLYTKGAVGEERKPPHKMELLPFEKGPQTLAAARPEQAAGGLRHPTVPPPMPGNRRAADRLLTLSTPVEFSYRTAPALLLFHGTVRFFVSGLCAEIARTGLFLYPLLKLPASG